MASAHWVETFGGDLRICTNFATSRVSFGWTWPLTGHRGSSLVSRAVLTIPCTATFEWMTNSTVTKHPFPVLTQAIAPVETHLLTPVGVLVWWTGGTSTHTITILHITPAHHDSMVLCGIKAARQPTWTARGSRETQRGWAGAPSPE